MDLRQQTVWLPWLLVLVVLKVADGQTAWSDCHANETSDPVYVHTFVMSPLPVTLPGIYNVTFESTISRQVNMMTIDVEIGRTNDTTRETEKIYPLDDRTWRIYHGCETINKLLFWNRTEHANDLDIQIDLLMAGSLSYHPGCPLLPGKIKFRQQDVVLGANLLPVSAVLKGRYIVKVNFRTVSDETVGCFQFHTIYGGHVLELYFYALPDELLLLIFMFINL